MELWCHCFQNPSSHPWLAPTWRICCCLTWPVPATSQHTGSLFLYSYVSSDTFSIQPLSLQNDRQNSLLASPDLEAAASQTFDLCQGIFQKVGLSQHDLLCQLLSIYTGIYYYFKIIIIIIIIIIVITITTIIILLITITILLLIIIIITTIIIIMTKTIIVTIIHHSGGQHFMMDGTQTLEPDGSGLGSQFHHLLAV